MIAARPAKPGSRRRSGGGPPTSSSRPTSSGSFSRRASTARAGSPRRRSADRDDRAAGGAPRRSAGLRAAFLVHPLFRHAPRPSSRPPVLRFAPVAERRCCILATPIPRSNERVADELDGRLLLRIEDLDRTRCKPRLRGARSSMISPGSASASTSRPRRQSEHGDDYAAALDASRGARSRLSLFLQPGGGRARRRRPRSRRRAALSGRLPRSAARRERRARLARGRKSRAGGSTCAARSSWRPRELVWREFGEGTSPVAQVADPAVWGDVVLRGTGPRRELSSGGDGRRRAQGVTDVVRGRDLFAATSVHRLLQELLACPRRAIATTGSCSTPTATSCRRAASRHRLARCGRKA